MTTRKTNTRHQMVLCLGNGHPAHPPRESKYQFILYFDLDTVSSLTWEFGYLSWSEFDGPKYITSSKPAMTRRNGSLFSCLHPWVTAKIALPSRHLSTTTCHSVNFLETTLFCVRSVTKFSYKMKISSDDSYQLLNIQRITMHQFLFINI